MENDKMTEERRTGVSEKRVRVFPRRLRNKEVEGDRPDQRRGEDRRKGDRRCHKEEKQG